MNRSQSAGPFTRIAFLGDTLVGGEAQATLDAHGASYSFDGIRHLLENADLVVANHEGPITRQQVPDVKLDTGKKRYWYRAQPASVGALRDAGIGVVSLANNHVLDFGAGGLADTTVALDGAGIEWCGAGSTRAAARRPAIVARNGLRIGFVSVMQRYDIYIAERLYASKTKPGPLLFNERRMRSDLDRLALQVDVRVVLMHWGRNYRKRNPRQVRLADQIVAAGADLVIGHHPHIAQPIEIQGRVPICYSLGNGPLGTPGRFHSGRPPYGLIVSIDFDHYGRTRALSAHLILVDNAHVAFQPQVADDRDARTALRRLLPTELEWREDGRGGLTSDLETSETARQP